MSMSAVGRYRIMAEPVFFKRYRMERDLKSIPVLPALPAGFTCHSWSSDLAEPHAEVLYRSFRAETDVAIFPSLGSLTGCWELMCNLVSRENFVPGATWLITSPDGPCATIQGLGEGRIGAIQNVGVVPEQRRKGLGACLVLLALHGFGQAGFQCATLEVTARNTPAIRLYDRLGFRATRILYKPTHTISQEFVIKG
jgi:RimJ/RimL family protein N-acetyltransferase